MNFGKWKSVTGTLRRRCRLCLLRKRRGSGERARARCRKTAQTATHGQLPSGGEDLRAIETYATRAGCDGQSRYVVLLCCYVEFELIWGLLARASVTPNVVCSERQEQKKPFATTRPEPCKPPHNSAQLKFRAGAKCIDAPSNS
jgi:hypothetical protein